MRNDTLDSLTEPNILWKDRRRVLGMPITFTKYRMSDDRIFTEVGLVNTKYDELLLYRVRDIGLSMRLGQKLFGVGTVVIDSTDDSTPHLMLRNIKRPRQVKELIHRQVEEAKLANRVRIGEYMNAGVVRDSDGDGIPDYLDRD